MVVIDVADKVLSIGSAVANILALYFYNRYRNRTESARIIKNSTVWTPDSELYSQVIKEKDQVLPYTVVEGTVKDLGRVLHSHHSHKDGVIKHSEIIEHRSKRVNGFWTEMKKVIKDSTDYVPFAIIKPGNKDMKLEMEVLEPLEASQIIYELDSTHDHFEPNKRSFLEDSFDRLFGEVTKGIQETESMLLTGTSVLGVGKVFLEKGSLKMGVPDDSRRSFIITKMRKPELVRSLESQSSSYKFWSIVCFLIGGSMLAFFIWRHLRKLMDEKKRRLEFEEIRRVLRQQGAESGNDNSLRQDDICVVCLTNARQVITLNCGHISMCAMCAELLPYPKKCPVCRARIEKFLPIFRS